MQAYDYAPFQRNFNSIKVRLKHAVALTVTQDSLFQFHKGTIKTIIILLFRAVPVISIP